MRPSVLSVGISHHKRQMKILTLISDIRMQFIDCKWRGMRHRRAMFDFCETLTVWGKKITVAISVFYTFLVFELEVWRYGWTGEKLTVLLENVFQKVSLQKVGLKIPNLRKLGKNISSIYNLLCRKLANFPPHN